MTQTDDYNFALEAAAQIVEEGVEAMSVDREHLLRRRAAAIRALRLPASPPPVSKAEETLMDFLRRENRETFDKLKALQEDNGRLREQVKSHFSLDEIIQAVKTAVVGSLQGLGNRPMHERTVAALRALRGQSL